MTDVAQSLDRDADDLSRHRCITIPSGQLYPPGHDYVDRVTTDNDRPSAILRNIQTLYSTGRLAGTGYLSILLVNRSAEYSVGAPFTTNLLCFDPKNIVKLMTEASCNCVASTYGELASASRCYAHRILFLVKPNRNKALNYSSTHDQALYTSMEQAFSMGAAVADATIYFGSKESCRQIEKISATPERAHELGITTVLWAYLRDSTFREDSTDYHVLADPIGRMNHLVATIGADVVRQKTTENNGSYKAINCGYAGDRVYSKLTSENPIDLVHYQLTNCCTGWAGLINSGGAAGGETDLSDAVRTAVISKRVGGMRLILEHKVFKKSVTDGVELISAI